jgi:cupin fold WbuC family metalloprotein
MKIIHHQLLNESIEKAQSLPRKRVNYNFHESYEANVQRMLNAMEPGTYVQPHKHEDPDKMEVFIILKGKALVVEFDDMGNVIAHCIISAKEGIYGTEIAPRIWHCIIPLESGTVVYEVKDGPYSPIDDKNFAKWAPREGDPDCEQYTKVLIEKCVTNLDSH